MKNYTLVTTSGDKFLVRAASLTDAKASLPAGSVMHWWNVQPTAKQIRRSKSAMRGL